MISNRKIQDKLAQEIRRLDPEEPWPIRHQCYTCLYSCMAYRKIAFPQHARCYCRTVKRYYTLPSCLALNAYILACLYEHDNNLLTVERN